MQPETKVLSAPQVNANRPLWQVHALIDAIAPRCVMVSVQCSNGWRGRLLRNHAQVDLFVGGRPHMEAAVRDAWRLALSMERPS